MWLRDIVLLVLLAVLSGGQAAGQAQPAPVNASIDMQGFLRVSSLAAMHRSSRLIAQEEFARMSGEPGTVVLDARSRDKYEELHVKGAINLSFPDIDVESLYRTLPDKTARILIYCNNNFLNAESPFPTKLPSASLNLSTYVTLYNYGYRNVYELGDTLDIAQSTLEFEATAKKP